MYASAVGLQRENLRTVSFRTAHWCKRNPHVHNLEIPTGAIWTFHHKFVDVCQHFMLASL